MFKSPRGKVTKSTKCISDNGLNPVFNQELTFEVDVCENTFFYINVMDQDIASSDHIAFAVYPGFIFYLNHFLFLIIFYF